MSYVHAMQGALVKHLVADPSGPYLVRKYIGETRDKGHSVNSRQRKCIALYVRVHCQHSCVMHQHCMGYYTGENCPVPNFCSQVLVGSQGGDALTVR